jgi:hypothetical protein
VIIMNIDDDDDIFSSPEIHDLLAEEHDRLENFGADAEVLAQDNDDVVEVEVEENPIDALQRQFEALKQERDAAAAERDAERTRVRELENKQSASQASELHTHKALIESAMSAATSDIEAAKRIYRDARARSDIEAELEATEALADAREQLRTLNAGLQEIDRRIAAPAPVPAKKTDPIEEYIASNFTNPRDQDWVRRHKDDLFSAPERGKLAEAGHALATLKHKIAPGTDEYYAFMDEHMDYVAPKVKEPVEAPSPKPAAKSVRYAAPVSRSTPSSSARLAEKASRASPQIKALAESMGMTAAEYIANAEAIKKNGGNIPGTSRNGRF